MSLNTRSGSLKFAFIGLGPTTVAIAAALVKRGVEPRDMIAIDPRPPVGYLTECVEAIHMDRMRSSWEMNVLGEKDALRQYARSVGLQIEKYRTPPWFVLQGHTQAVWRSLGIEQVHTNVQKFAPWGDGSWILRTAYGSYIEARNIVVATGSGSHRERPIAHAISLPETRIERAPDGPVAIIGAGLTAAHAAEYFLNNGTPVTMFARRGLQVSERDATPEWFDNPNCRTSGCESCVNGDEMRRQLRSLQPRARVELVMKGARRGTVNDEHHAFLFDKIGSGKLSIERRSVRSVSADGRIFDDRGWESSGFASVYDARGFRVHVDNLKAIGGLREAVGNRQVAGLPILDDETGEVRKGLILAGALSPLFVGPMAHTIAGPVIHGRALAKNLDRLLA